jgi:hypothetical protein
MSNEPMTEAERLVAEHLAHLINEDPDHNQSLRMAENRGYEVGDEILRMKPEWLAEPARAIVAKLRPILAAEALEDMAVRLEEMHFIKGERAWPFVAEIRKAAALRTTTPEETR